MAAAFRKTVSARTAYPAIIEALSLLRFGLFGRVHPDQGLVIAAELYARIGGHRDTVDDPEADLLGPAGAQAPRHAAQRGADMTP